MDVKDTPEVRDLLACAGAVVSLNDSVSMLRVASMPQFEVDVEQLRAGVRALPKDATSAGVASVLQKIAGGPAVLETARQTKEEIGQCEAKAGAALEIVIRRFGIDRSARATQTILKFVREWEEKAVAETGVLGELLEYLELLPEARGVIRMDSEEQDAVVLSTAHGAKGLEFDHVFILRVRSSSFPANFKEPLFEFPQGLRDPESMGQGEDKDLHDQEERRLFYVAMTRARDSLTLYGKPSTGKNPVPAKYLRELMEDRTLRDVLRQRPARGLQTEIFAETAEPLAGARCGEWLTMPPAIELGTRLSASAVNSYKNCPLQFKLAREWRLPTEPPAALQYGATMHRVLRAYADSVRFGRPMDEAALVELFRDDLKAAGLQDPYQCELYEKQGIEQLKQFLVLWSQKPVSVLHTEESFEFSFDGVTVIGTIDRIDDEGEGRVSITDYKTGRAQTQDDAEQSLQLSIYALAAKEKWGYQPERLALYNLADNTSMISSRTLKQLEKAKAEVAEVAKGIAAGAFEAKPGFHCGFCPYRNLCPATETRFLPRGNA